MQSRYQYCCIQYRSSDTACPWCLSSWPLKLCHKLCARLCYPDHVPWGCQAFRVGHRWEGSSSQQLRVRVNWLPQAGDGLCWDEAAVNFLPPMMTVKIIWQPSFQITLSDGLITSSMLWHLYLNCSKVMFSERGTVLLQLLEKALWCGILHRHTVLCALCNFLFYIAFFRIFTGQQWQQRHKISQCLCTSTLLSCQCDLLGER